MFLCPFQEYAAIALRVAKELYCYHQTVADILKPLLFSDFQEDFENATLTNVDGKDEIVSTWLTISEVKIFSVFLLKTICELLTIPLECWVLESFTDVNRASNVVLMGGYFKPLYVFSSDNDKA